MWDPIVNLDPSMALLQISGNPGIRRKTRVIRHGWEEVDQGKRRSTSPLTRPPLATDRAVHEEPFSPALLCCQGTGIGAYEGGERDVAVATHLIARVTRHGHAEEKRDR